MNEEIQRKDTSLLSFDLQEKLKKDASFSVEEFLDFFCEHKAIKQLLLTFNITWNTPQLFLQALTHSSFFHEYPHLVRQSNERLEFLGDSVLEVIVSEHLFKKYPDWEEGPLSKLRGSMVNQKELAKWAEKLNLPHVLLVGRGELKNQGMFLPSTLSNTFEAFIGALLLDQGWQKTKEVLLNFFMQNNPHWDEAIGLENFDPKSQLQQYTLELYQQVPEYKSVEVEQNGSKVFLVKLVIKGKEVDQEYHLSKRKACELLAQRSLNQQTYQNL